MSAGTHPAGGMKAQGGWVVSKCLGGRL